jgi:hypothetical protein
LPFFAVQQNDALYYSAVQNSVKGLSPLRHDQEKRKSPQDLVEMKVVLAHACKYFEDFDKLCFRALLVSLSLYFSLFIFVLFTASPSLELPPLFLYFALSFFSTLFHFPHSGPLKRKIR